MVKGLDRNMDRSEEAKQEFASLLKQTRECLGLSSKEMAEKYMLPYLKYWSYENAKNLPKNKAEKERIEQVAETILTKKVASKETIIEPEETSAESQEQPQEPQDSQKNQETADPEVAQSETQFTPFLPPHSRVRPETKEQYPMPEAHKAARDDSNDNRTLHEQLQDLGVDVVTVPKNGGVKPDSASTPKAGIKNIRWYDGPTSNNQLGKHICIRESRISVGAAAVDMLGGKGAILKIGCADYGDIKVPLIKAVEEHTPGKTVVITKEKKTHKICGKYKIAWLRERGVDGKYELKPMANRENTYVGVPVQEVK